MYKEIKKMNPSEALRFGFNAFLAALPFLLFLTLIKAFMN